MYNFTPIIQWFLYSLILGILLIPFLGLTLKTITGGLILGLFAGLINQIRTNTLK